MIDDPEKIDVFSCIGEKTGFGITNIHYPESGVNSVLNEDLRET